MSHGRGGRSGKWQKGVTYYLNGPLIRQLKFDSEPRTAEVKWDVLHLKFLKWRNGGHVKQFESSSFWNCIQWIEVNINFNANKSFTFVIANNFTIWSLNSLHMNLQSDSVIRNSMGPSAFARYNCEIVITVMIYEVK